MRFKFLRVWFPNIFLQFKGKAIKKSFLIVGLVLLTLTIIAASNVTETPTAYVKGILERVMATNTAPTLTDSNRSQSIGKIIENSFDFKIMAKEVLGPAFESITSTERKEFIETFSYLFQDSYTRQVINFLKKDEIRYGHELLEGKTARVATVIIRPNETIPVTYLLHNTPSGWVLYDAIVDGESILENYRIQFTQVIRNKSFKFLLEKMQQQRLAMSSK